MTVVPSADPDNNSVLHIEVCLLGFRRNFKSFVAIPEPLLKFRASPVAKPLDIDD